MEVVTDMKGYEIQSGQRVVVQHDDSLGIGIVTHFTGGSVVVQVTRPDECKRVINKNLAKYKILILDNGSN